MCGRYELGMDDEALLEIVDELKRRAGLEDVKLSGEVFPTDVVPVIARGRSGGVSVFPMKWGYALPDGKIAINARSETAIERALFKDGMLHRRCLIPATNYYEWEKRGRERVKYAIRPGGRILYMAGIYRMENERPEFVILTRDAAPGIQFIHNRMPVMFSEDVKDAWLDRNSDPEEVLRQAVQGVEYTPKSPQQLHI